MQLKDDVESDFPKPGFVGLIYRIALSTFNTDVNRIKYALWRGVASSTAYTSEKSLAFFVLSGAEGKRNQH